MNKHIKAFLFLSNHNLVNSVCFTTSIVILKQRNSSPFATFSAISSKSIHHRGSPFPSAFALSSTHPPTFTTNLILAPPYQPLPFIFFFATAFRSLVIHYSLIPSCYIAFKLRVPLCMCNMCYSILLNSKHSTFSRNSQKHFSLSICSTIQ